MKCDHKDYWRHCVHRLTSFLNVGIQIKPVHGVHLPCLHSAVHNHVHVKLSYINY